MDIAMMVWVVQGSGRTVLVDAGFAREKFITQWKPADYVTPAAAVENGLGIKPADVAFLRPGLPATVKITSNLWLLEGLDAVVPAQ
jgi:hypothetical protein